MKREMVSNVSNFRCLLNSRERVDVGKYGSLWMQYIQKEYPKRYDSLLRFGDLESKAIEVDEVARDLFDDIEREWIKSHRPKKWNSFIDVYQLRIEARMLAEEVVMHDVVSCYH